MKFKMADLKNQDPDQLQEKMTQLRKELMRYRFQQKTGKLEKHGVLRETRRNIARILTVIHDKKSGGRL